MLCRNYSYRHNNFVYFLSASLQAFKDLIPALLNVSFEKLKMLENPDSPVPLPLSIFEVLKKVFES